MQYVTGPAEQKEAAGILGQYSLTRNEQVSTPSIARFSTQAGSQRFQMNTLWSWNEPGNISSNV